MGGLLDFFATAEKLHVEARLTRTSADARENVSGHSWMVALMAMVFAPRLGRKLDMERVLKFAIIHDLPEAVAHDIPLHETYYNPDVKKKKDAHEVAVINDMADAADWDELRTLHAAYEARACPESQFVKQLDLLNASMQVALCRDLSYIGAYDNGVYWRLQFSRARRDFLATEPVLAEFLDVINAHLARRMRDELGLNADDFRA